MPVDFGICNTSAVQVANFHAQTIFSFHIDFPFCSGKAMLISLFNLLPFRCSYIYWKPCLIARVTAIYLNKDWRTPYFNNALTENPHLLSLFSTSDYFQYLQYLLSLLWCSYPLFCFCSPLNYYSIWPFMLSLMLLINTSCSGIMCWLSPICLIILLLFPVSVLTKLRSLLTEPPVYNPCVSLDTRQSDYCI